MRILSEPTPMRFDRDGQNFRTPVQGLPVTFMQDGHHALWPIRSGNHCIVIARNDHLLTLHTIEPCRIALEPPTPRSTLAHVIASLRHLYCWVDVVAYMSVQLYGCARTTVRCAPLLVLSQDSVTGARCVRGGHCHDQNVRTGAFIEMWAFKRRRT